MASARIVDHSSIDISIRRRSLSGSLKGHA
jgi:hypothetical protein